MRIVHDLLSTPIELKAAFDISATARQRGFFAPGHPVIMKNAIAAELKSFGSEAGYSTVVDYISAHPRLNLVERSGLHLSTRIEAMDPLNLAKREEFFPRSYAQQIPVIGRGVRVSNRGYNAVLDVQRMEVFDQLAGQLESWSAKQGKEVTKAQYDGLADFINNGFWSPPAMMSVLPRLTPCIERIPRFWR